MKLTDRHEDMIAFQGKEYKLGLYYDVVLRSFELLKDARFNDMQKLDIILDMFVINHEDLRTLDVATKAKFVETIFQRFVHELDQEDEQEEDNQAAASSNGKKLYDLEKDAEYIYASFLFDYGLDLFEQQGKLHWRKFKALLSSLSEDSKFKKVVSIRAEKLPAPTRHNADYRKRLLELKSIYRLEDTQNVEDIDRQFDQLAASLRPTKR
ncbi:Gp15 family bacteriophage protein [Alteribacillus sp. JSM 102045]|uniref:Gp15 family bacteriophage protein n=1 Tax=Alteribacillus sp. JSM 102045 TaxID=1562101 RepID=UPI0035C14A52